MNEKTLNLVEIRKIISNRVENEIKVLVSNKKDFFAFVDEDKVEDFETMTFGLEKGFTFKDNNGNDLHKYVRGIIFNSELDENFELSIIGALNGILVIDNGDSVTKEEIKKVKNSEFTIEDEWDRTLSNQAKIIRNKFSKLDSIE